MEAILNDKNAEVLALYDSLFNNSDKFEQKIRILSKKISEGGVRKKKDTDEVVTNEFGEPLKWDDKYYINYTAINTGGNHSVAIPQNLWIELQENVTYIAKGEIQYKIFGEAYNSTAVVVFKEFINERDNLVANLALLSQKK